MATTEPADEDPPDPGQTREVFEVLGDEPCWLVVRALLSRGPLTQAALLAEMEVSRPTVSRALTRLRIARVIASSGGRNARHQIVLRDEVLNAIAAGDRLAEAVNARRMTGQRDASRQTRRDRMRSVAGDGDGREGGPANSQPAG